MKCIVHKQWRGIMPSPHPQEIPGGIAIELKKRGFLEICRDIEDDVETASMTPPETMMKRKRGRPKGSKNKVKYAIPDA